MYICDIEEALQEIKQGKMIILMDDENRENEGDLVIAAEKVTPEAINFMAKHGRGLICLAMSPQLVDRLNLPLMSSNNQSKFGTNFTVSIEAKHGVTTGISAFDRAKTILTAINDNATANDIVTPGHVFPLRAEKYGVLERAGQTEGSVDLAKLSGLKSAAVICEIMRDDGTMARKPDLIKFAKKHKIKIAFIKDLIKYRLRQDKSIIRKISETQLPTQFGIFKLISYESLHDNKTHLALVKGSINPNAPILARVHSECLTGDVFGSKRCDCGQQLQIAMQMIQQQQNGIILYLRQEGRGIGLANKLKAYALQDQGQNTIDANHQLGFDADLRDYGIAMQILLDLGVTKLRLLTNNPRKVIALNNFGLEVIERVPLEGEIYPENKFYLTTKKNELGHLLNLNKRGENYEYKNY